MIGEGAFSSVGYDAEKSSNDRIQAYRTKQGFSRFGAPLVRIALTAVIELVIALCFGFKGKRRVLLILGANVLTQAILNLTLINFWENDELTVTLICEIVVFVIEWLIYRWLFYRGEEKEQKKKRIFVYTLIANAVTFLVGILLPIGFPLL